jgi:hypothetical protein
MSETPQRTDYEKTGREAGRPYLVKRSTRCYMRCPALTTFAVFPNGETAH